MKKIGYVVLILLLMCGCEKKIDPKQKEYQDTVEQLQEKKEKKFDTEFPFVVDVSLDSFTDDEITYSVVIDQPVVPMKNIKAIAIHDVETDDIFPSIGILDEPLHLYPNEVDESSKKVKGIALVGYIKTKKKIGEFHMNLKVMVSYEDMEGNIKRYYYYHKI